MLLLCKLKICCIERERRRDFRRIKKFDLTVVKNSVAKQIDWKNGKFEESVLLKSARKLQTVVDN